MAAVVTIHNNWDTGKVIHPAIVRASDNAMWSNEGQNIAVNGDSTPVVLHDTGLLQEGDGFYPACIVVGIFSNHTVTGTVEVGYLPGGQSLTATYVDPVGGSEAVNWNT